MELRPRHRRGGTAAPAPPRCLIAGVGASAGGLEAFSRLLKALPRDTGLGFVLVQHLAPDHASALPEILSRVTAMPVVQATEGMPVRPNRVYVIPPDASMTLRSGELRLRRRVRRSGAFLSIDAFFESLAADCGPWAIGVLLSGNATDGTRGLEAIKGEGGITFAQDESAANDSMPRHAVAAGCVDAVLSPEEIARELARIARHPLMSPAGPGNGDVPGRGARGGPGGGKEARGWPAPAGGRKAVAGEPGLHRVLSHLRLRSGVDFAAYKPGTIQRRVARRMILRKAGSADAYVESLRKDPKELDALFADVLIGVTSFFRNPAVFDALKDTVFPRRIAESKKDEPVRVWVPGCASGEEAYSVAIAYAEASEGLPRAPRLQVFATDLSESQLEKGRQGLYPRTRVADVSAERLKRFFDEEPAGYRVRKSLRDMIVFARQNVLADPPFSRVDLISCRNLLIYLDAGVQQRLLPVFHYALKSGAFLLLGASESVLSSELFEAVDKRHRLYRRKGTPTPAHRLAAPARRASRSRAHAGDRREIEFHPDLEAQHEADRMTLHACAPPGVLVNGDLRVVQFRGQTTAFLEPPRGRASFDLMKMARSEVASPLRTAIARARREKRAAMLKSGAGRQAVHIEAIPLKNVKGEYLLVQFWRAGPRRLPSAEGAAAPGGRRSAAAETELAESRDYLRSVQERHEASMDELQASSEEVQSANEELQSINEELETSKEELESANEELTTVNEELVSRNSDVSRLNGDLRNLLVGMDAAILLLGSDLRIRMFNPKAENTFHVGAADVGRPLREVRHSLDFEGLEEFVDEAVTGSHEAEREVRDGGGRWHLLRARPCLSPDGKVDGAILMLMDIDTLKKGEIEAREARDLAEAAFHSARHAVLLLGADLRIRSANDAFLRNFQLGIEAVRGASLAALGDGAWNDPNLRTLLEEVLPRNSIFTDFEFVSDFPSLGKRTLMVNARRIECDERPPLILMTIEDVTDRVHATAALRISENRFRRLFESAKDGILLIDAATERITDANPFIAEYLGYALQEMKGKKLWELGLIGDEQANQAAMTELKERGFIRYENLPLRTKSGQSRDVEFVSNYYMEDGHSVIQCNIRDISARRQTELAGTLENSRLAEQAARLEQMVRDRTASLQETVGELEAFSYSVAHDMRAPLRGMLGFARLILNEHAAKLDDLARGYLERIVRSALRMDALIRDVLDYTRVLRADAPLAPVDMDRLVRDVVGSYEEWKSPFADIQVVGKLPVVMGHEGFLTQCVSNLVGNAVKFVRAGARPAVRIGSEESGKRVRIWFQDNGIGIADAERERIFRMFERIHTSEEYQGTGIGLTIVRKAVERLGGSVGFDSEPGKGSRFWIELQEAGEP